MIADTGLCDFINSDLTITLNYQFYYYEAYISGNSTSRVYFLIGLSNG